MPTGRSGSVPFALPPSTPIRRTPVSEVPSGPPPRVSDDVSSFPTPPRTATPGEPSEPAGEPIVKSEPTEAVLKFPWSQGEIVDLTDLMDSPLPLPPLELNLSELRQQLHMEDTRMEESRPSTSGTDGEKKRTLDTGANEDEGGVRKKMRVEQDGQDVVRPQGLRHEPRQAGERHQGHVAARNQDDSYQRYGSLRLIQLGGEQCLPFRCSEARCLASGLADGNHNFMLTKRTESFYGTVIFFGLVLVSLS